MLFACDSYVASSINFDDHSALNKYCPFLNNDNGEKCNNYEEIIISTFITFLVSFISSNDGGYLDSDNFAEYAILWLCYQLNLKTENSIDNLNKFYNKYMNAIKKYVEGSQDVENYNSYGNDFVKEFEKLNGDFSITGNNSYREILSSLSTNYNNFKSDCAKNCSKCRDISTLPDINSPQGSVQDKVDSSGVTSPSSSIEKTLIPALLIFAIPVLF
ncbi:Plasmodium variant antigen protein Cir/Yir/Bir, putative [Plasmodium chabaudi adami]|uniref:Plasmodium variant antigen protein Cir/Yir/Bir, putative n=1 Tax=Plasmodium chabaudi adami TaxID=5826 RepID=A0A1D3LBU0_PLACE|nr:Plasmodium variant antigen protein Cir/Yir/Bir, putative [Plasmodium chabaudi adami]